MRRCSPIAKRRFATLPNSSTKGANRTRVVDARIAAVAERQHGVIGHPQLVSLGLSRASIQRRVRAGRLHRVHQGVYAVGHKRLAQRGRLLDIGVKELIDRYPRRAGTPALKALTPTGITREELEHRFHAFVEKFDLPKPLRNQPLTIEHRTVYPDAMWPHQRLIVELDSRAAHDTTSRFDSDRERDRLLARAGWRVIRLTWKHLSTDPERVAADLRALIA